jgi:hypothetical protein
MYKSVCPNCAGGCGQRVYVKDGKVIDIEGDYDSPIGNGCLCPTGLSTALASLSFILSLLPGHWRTLDKLESTEIVSMTTKLGLIAALPRLLGPIGKHVFKGHTGILFEGGTVGMVLSTPLFIRIIMRIMGKSTPRPVNVGLSSLVLIGGLILRYVWVVAGRRADVPPMIQRWYITPMPWKVRCPDFVSC